ncbi:hypothetical protein Q1695_014858 [Nippostrongylus brasiliensis]|nr:hypothetical protein Q1695_014858 [Nippostrongylus brasiliensis]
MKRRSIQILRLRETHWKGEKAKEIGEGIKLFYEGEDGKKNGAGVVISETIDALEEKLKSFGQLPSSYTMATKGVQKG